MANPSGIIVKQLLRTFPEASWIRYVATSTIGPVTSLPKDIIAAAKPFEEIPGFKVLPVLGTSWVFMPLIGKYSIERALQYDTEKYEKFGPITRDTFGKLNFVSIHEPDDVEAVFKNESQFPKRFDFDTLKTYREMRQEWFSTLGVLVLQGKEWFELRSKLQKNLLNTKVIEGFVEPMAEVVQDLIQSIIRNKDHNNEVPDFLDKLFKWALESVAYAGLDKRLGCLDEHPSQETVQMVESAQRTFALMNELESFTGNIPYWQLFPTPKWREYVRIMDTFSSIAFKYANQTLMDVQEKVKSGKQEKMTMVQSMLATKDLDVAGVVSMLIDMLLAGIETTSHSVGFLFYALAKNPDKQEKLYQEIIKFLPNPSDKITPEILRKMTYVKQCIKESQRLYPIIRGIPRTLEQEWVICGYRVPAGTYILSAHYVIQQQEKYFKDAASFIPERWMDAKNKPHPFSFMPFGFGIRSCIGRRLAELEMQCITIETLRRFKIEYHHEDIGMIMRLVIVADRPLRFSFVDREKGQQYK